MARAIERRTALEALVIGIASVGFSSCISGARISGEKEDLSTNIPPTETSLPPEPWSPVFRDLSLSVMDEGGSVFEISIPFVEINGGNYEQDPQGYISNLLAKFSYRGLSGELLNPFILPDGTVNYRSLEVSGTSQNLILVLGENYILVSNPANQKGIVLKNEGEHLYPIRLERVEEGLREVYSLDPNNNPVSLGKITQEGGYIYYPIPFPRASGGALVLIGNNRNPQDVQIIYSRDLSLENGQISPTSTPEPTPPSEATPESGQKGPYEVPEPTKLTEEEARRLPSPDSLWGTITNGELVEVAVQISHHWYKFYMFSFKIDDVECQVLIPPELPFEEYFEGGRINFNAEELKRFMKEDLGFSPVFRDERGNEIERVRIMRKMVEQLGAVPGTGRRKLQVVGWGVIYEHGIVVGEDGQEYISAGLECIREVYNGLYRYFIENPIYSIDGLRYYNQQVFLARLILVDIIEFMYEATFGFSKYVRTWQEEMGAGVASILLNHAKGGGVDRVERQQVLLEKAIEVFGIEPVQS